MKILVNDGMEAEALENLKALGYDVDDNQYKGEELFDKIKEVDVIVVRSATKVRKELIDEALKTGKLKLVIRGGVGVDNIDVKYAEENGIVVRNTPLASSASVAELASPRAANSSTAAAPIPREPPVTTTVFIIYTSGAGNYKLQIINY